MHENDPTYADTAVNDVVAPTFPRLLRELDTYIGQQKRILVELTQSQKGVRFDRNVVLMALACAATDAPYPADPEKLETALNHAREGRFDRAVQRAALLVEQEISVAYAARSGLKALDMLGEGLPAAWSNLGPHLLAREINRTTHTVFRGRVPGWKD
jgi:hypothetical protein